MCQTQPTTSTMTIPVRTRRYGFSDHDTGSNAAIRVECHKGFEGGNTGLRNMPNTGGGRPKTHTDEGRAKTNQFDDNKPFSFQAKPHTLKPHRGVVTPMKDEVDTLNTDGDQASVCAACFIYLSYFHIVTHNPRRDYPPCEQCICLLINA